MKTGLHSTEGILLRKTPYGDSDLVVLFLTAEGTESYFAKAARRSHKRFAGQLDYFRRLRLLSRRTQEGGWRRLESCELLEVWEPLWQDPDRYRLACRWSELVRQLLPPGKGASIYAFIGNSLRYLASHAASREIALRFELQLSMQLGYGPNFERLSMGDNRALSAATFAWLSAYQQGETAPPPLTEAQLAEIEALLGRHWQELV